MALEKARQIRQHAQHQEMQHTITACQASPPAMGTTQTHLARVLVF
jgi:hypothetical protein